MVQLGWCGQEGGLPVAEVVVCLCPVTDTNYGFYNLRLAANRKTWESEMPAPGRAAQGDAATGLTSRCHFAVPARRECDCDCNGNGNGDWDINWGSEGGDARRGQGSCLTSKFRESMCKFVAVLSAMPHTRLSLSRTLMCVCVCTCCLHVRVCARGMCVEWASALKSPPLIRKFYPACLPSGNKQIEMTKFIVDFMCAHTYPDTHILRRAHTHTQAHIHRHSYTLAGSAGDQPT